MTKTKRSKKTKAAITNKNKLLEAFVDRARHATYVKNVEYFQIARALYASRTNSCKIPALTKSEVVKPEFLPFVVYEYYNMYETYIGDYDGRPARFDYDYLFYIELPVLKYFLPYLRRADIFNDYGVPTTFRVSPKSITAMIRPRGDEKHTDCVDLASFFVSQADIVMGPCDEYRMGIRVAHISDETFEVMDDPSDQIPLNDLKDGVLAPKYDDISKRYYDWFGQGDLPSLN